MQHFLLAFYILFFATGFMGGAALYVLGLRIRSRLIRPLLAFQLLFLLGLGIIVVYYYLETLPGGINPAIRLPLSIFMTLINAALYAVAILLIRRLSPPAGRTSCFPLAAELLSVLVIAKSLANILIHSAYSLGYGGAALLAVSKGWSLAGFIVSGLAMAAFGIVARGKMEAHEPPAMRPLMRAYGLCAIAFAPMGLIEFAVESAGLAWLPSISLDHFFYLAWNIVSMSAAIRLFKPSEGGVPILDAVPEERMRSLGISGREAEMAVMIARGLANKEIAAELGISPATVRTHIYNLYQKAGARSRVELLNKLRT
jgi:DNA-binding CsgD family transcriptional regulator